MEKVLVIGAPERLDLIRQVVERLLGADERRVEEYRRVLHSLSCLDPVLVEPVLAEIARIAEGEHVQLPRLIVLLRPQTEPEPLHLGEIVARVLESHAPKALPHHLPYLAHSVDPDTHAARARQHQRKRGPFVWKDWLRRRRW